jgi:hypothetical protein
MHLSAILAVVVAVQVASTSPLERTLDLRQVLSNDAALSSVEVLYRIEGRVIAVRGDGTVLKQSTRQQLQLLPTCKGAVAIVDVRHLLETMLAAQFLDYDNDGLLDLLTVTTKGTSLWRNVGKDFVEVSATSLPIA